MKGVVFTEFMEMVEARFSADMLDDIIEDAQIKSAVRTPQWATIRLPSWWRLITLHSVAAWRFRTDLPLRPSSVWPFCRALSVQHSVL
jgi:hypothetical protein